LESSKGCFDLMRTIIVTGSSGLVGSETVRCFAGEGARVIGIDNDMRAEFFGAEASTKKTRDDLIENVSSYEHLSGGSAMCESSNHIIETGNFATGCAKFSRKSPTPSQVRSE
jgi:CDP-paratose 2-epimerase